MTMIKRLIGGALVVLAFCAWMFLVVIVLSHIFGYRWLFQ